VSTQRKENAYATEVPGIHHPRSIWKLGILAASSALAGGLAASWWYRRTLTKLQNPILSDDIQKTGLSNQEQPYEDFEES
jgi:hypothetical protein